MVNPTKSLQRITKEENLSYGTAHCATEALGLHPYHVRIMHELLPEDPAKKVLFCEWFLAEFCCGNAQSRGLQHSIFFSDEAWFSFIDGICQQIEVWAPINGIKIIGPIFFSKTIDTDVYLDIIQQFVASLEITDCYCWFQKDTARPLYRRNHWMSLNLFLAIV